ncbi:MAG: hypothetical protein ACLP1X_21775 [Polyangiaceae bacterium]
MRARLAWGLVLLATVVFVWRALLAERQTVDDVFIFLRYARRLAEHGEYAFDPGVHVEGTSSVVWTLLIAFVWRAGLHGLGVAKGLSLATGALLPAASALAVRRAVPERPLVIAVPAIALAFDADLATWASSGMDTALWALACVACVALAGTRREGAAAVMSGALAWVRPEGPLFALATVAALARDRRTAVRLAILAAVPIALLSLSRVAYFHDILPNTFWAKMHSPAEGRDYSGPGYIASALERRPLLLVLVPLAAWRLRPGPAGRLALAFLASALLFALAAGGDWMPDRRLLVVALPMAAIAGAIAMGKTRATSLAIASTAALAVEGALTSDHAIDQRWREVEWIDERLSSYWPKGRPFVDPYPLDWMPTHLLYDLAPFVAPGDVVAHVDVGELPYVMGDVVFLDGFGLVDRYAGRLAFAPHDDALRAAAREEFFELRPAVAIMVIDERTARPFSAAEDAAMEDPRFVASWRELDRVPTWGDHPCVTYVRRDLRPARAEIAASRTRAWLGGVPDVKAAF